ncbi:MAG TPA: cupredoxin domain-containing protein [Frankiaceae bacterium]|jgi:plastocyanin|nr:cupredoxin domain-containing protein [Frankiaceae bacterium]
MRRRTLAVVAASAFAAIPAATPARAASTAVSMVDNAFKPRTATVTVGDTVTWRNDGSSAHEVTADAFKSGNVDPGKTFSWTATKAGTYSYVCRYHESLDMKGTLVVRAAGSSAAPAAPPTGHPNTGGDDVALGLLILGGAAALGLSLRYGWRTR